MKLQDLTSWHRFVYTQLYAAVLGSMLYDVLHFRTGAGALQVLEISITVLYCVDYFHLQSDLGSDQLPNATWRDVILDGIIAITFGIAYWFASDGHITTAYLALTGVGILFLLYYSTAARRSWWTIPPLTFLTLLFLLVASLAHQMSGIPKKLVALAWLPTIFYGLYVFGIVNRRRLRAQAV
jgi:hypothetical protein